MVDVLDSQVGICVAHVLEEGIIFLAHPRFHVVAGNIVPVDAVVVEVIEHS